MIRRSRRHQPASRLLFMPASAILSPVTVPPAGQARGPSADAAASAGDFAAALATEAAAETPLPVTPTTPVVPTDMPVPTLSAEENVAAEDAPAESGEAVIAPFLVQLAAAAVPGSTEGSGDEAMSSTAGAPSTNSSVLQPSAKPGLLTLPDEVPVAPVQTSLTDETPDAGASATAEKAKAAAVASVLEATAQRSASPAGDAALA
ncbi:MAG: hypothetical protein DCE92_06715, partial [Alphaproteobacteria bacterium]